MSTQKSPGVTLLGGCAGREALVTAGPGDRGAAGATGRGRLRASDADREQVIDTLKAAFVQGWLTRDQLGVRAGQALVVADLRGAGGSHRRHPRQADRRRGRPRSRWDEPGSR